MFVIPVITQQDGSIIAERPAPECAIMTVTTPAGVTVYEEGDELPTAPSDQE